MTVQLIGWRNQHQAGVRRPVLTILIAGLFLVGVTAAAQNGIGPARAFAGTGTPPNAPPFISDFSASHACSVRVILMRCGCRCSFFATKRRCRHCAKNEKS